MAHTRLSHHDTNREDDGGRLETKNIRSQTIAAPTSLPITIIVLLLVFLALEHSTSSSLPTMMSRQRLPPIDSMWFHRIFGFKEVARDYNATQRRLQQMQLFPENETILKRSDGVLLHCGSFAMPSLSELRQQCHQLLAQVNQQQQQHTALSTTSVTAAATATPPSLSPVFGPIQAFNIQSDAYALHADPIAESGIIQAASQFNCLEFPGPAIIPEYGISMYWSDRTQGPACAIACGAGTAYRNYLVKVNTTTTTTDPISGETTTTVQTTIGQRQNSQINTLDDMLQKLQSYQPDLVQPIVVKNGYANTNSSSALEQWKDTIFHHSDELRNLIKVGIQRHTQVTSVLPQQQLFVTQVYSSAIPVAYSRASDKAWEPMARLVLEGTYELTLLEGVRVALEKAITVTGTSTTTTPPPPTRVFLTLVGGGVFGNELEWIWSAIDRALRVMSDEYGVAMEVYVVHYDPPPPEAITFVQNWNQLHNNNAACQA